MQVCYFAKADRERLIGLRHTNPPEDCRTALTFGAVAPPCPGGSCRPGIGYSTARHQPRINLFPRKSSLTVQSLQTGSQWYEVKQFHAALFCYITLPLPRDETSAITLEVKYGLAGTDQIWLTAAAGGLTLPGAGRPDVFAFGVTRGTTSRMGRISRNRLGELMNGETYNRRSGWVVVSRIAGGVAVLLRWRLTGGACADCPAGGAGHRRSGGRAGRAAIPARDRHGTGVQLGGGQEPGRRCHRQGRLYRGSGGQGRRPVVPDRPARPIRPRWRWRPPTRRRTRRSSRPRRPISSVTASWSVPVSRPGKASSNSKALVAQLAGRDQRRSGADRHRPSQSRLYRHPLADRRPARRPPGRYRQSRARDRQCLAGLDHPVEADLRQLHAAAGRPRPDPRGAKESAAGCRSPWRAMGKPSSATANSP